jgi:hypothetical protein
MLEIKIKDTFVDSKEKGMEKKMSNWQSCCPMCACYENIEDRTVKNSFLGKVIHKVTTER